MIRSIGVLAVAISMALPASGQAGTPVPNLVYGTYTGSGGLPANLMLDLYLPLAGTPPHPVIVWVHGGGWSSGSRFPAPSQVTNLCALGYAVASIDYRLSGTAIWPAQIHDCRGAIRWLRANAGTYNLDPERFGVFGSSAGGHLVAMLATSGGQAGVTIGSATVDLEGTTGGNLDQPSRVQAVCDFFGPTDFLLMRDFPTFNHEAPTSPESNLLGGAIQTIPEKVATADPITFLSPDDPPMLILHGTNDTTVPYNQSELLHAAAGLEAGVPSTFFPVLNNGHGGPGFSSPAATALIQGYFDALLRSAPATRLTVAASDPSASESGDPGAIDVTRTGSMAAPLVVRLAWSGGAKRGSDYAPGDLLAVIPAGAASVSVPVVALDDGLVESPETVSLTICPSPEYRIAPALQTATVTIADDESGAGLSVVTIGRSDPSGAEPGADPAAFLVTRTAPLGAPLLVKYEVGGRAKNGIDYQALGGAVTIPANATSATVAVIPLDDPAIEPSETVILTLEASPAYAVGAAATASVFIADDDKNAIQPTVSVLVTDLDASDSGANPGAFVISRTLGVTNPLSVQLAISGSATPGADLAPIPPIVTIPAGSSFMTVPLTPLADTLVEGEERVVLTVVTAGSYQVASAPTRTIAIRDDDVPPPALPSLRIEVTPLEIGSLAVFTVGVAQPGQIFGVVAGFAPGFLDVPGFGRLLLDLPSAIIVGGGLAGPAGIGTVTAPVPLDFSVIGAEVWLQSFVVDAGGVSGRLSGLATRILTPR